MLTNIYTKQKITKMNFSVVNIIRLSIQNLELKIVVVFLEAMDEDIREGYQDLQVKNIETDLRQFLHCLASQDLNVIKQTEEYLRQLERKDGFYAELMVS